MNAGGTFASTLCIAVALVPTVALAQRPVTLRWTAPDGCPSENAVDAEVTRLLAAAKADPSRPPLEARATVTRAADEYRLRLEIAREGTTSVREVAGPTCLGVAHATALMVAMAIDPEAARAAAPPATPLPDSPPSGPAPAPQSSPTPTGAVTPAPAAAPKPVPPTPALAAPAAAGAPRVTPPPRDVRPDRPQVEPATRAAGWRLFGGGIGDIGTLGVPTLAVEVGGALLVRPFRVDAAVAFWPTREVALDDSGETGGRLDLITGALSTCWAPAPIARAVGPRLEIDLPCIGAEVGRMGGEGFGVTEEREGGGVWAAARLGAAGAFLFEPWVALRMRVEAVVPAVRPRFQLGGVGTVHEPVLAGRAALVLELAPEAR